MRTLSTVITIAVAVASFNNQTIMAGESQAAAALKPVPVANEVIATDIESEVELVSLGDFKLTAYCSCSSVAVNGLKTDQ